MVQVEFYKQGRMKRIFVSIRIYYSSINLPTPGQYTVCIIAVCII